MAFHTEPDPSEELPRSRREPGYAFRCMEDEGICDDGEDVDDDDDNEEDPEDDDDVHDGDPYDDDEMEGFDDWRMDDDIADRHGPGAYDDDADWNPDVQEELPELIYTEGCDDDGVDLAPCISLQRCSNRLSALSTSGVGDGGSGDVDAVRVMLLGVSESGRPSVGIDLGYACTQQQHATANPRDSLSHPPAAAAPRSGSSPHGADSPGPAPSSSPSRDLNTSVGSDSTTNTLDASHHASPTALSPSTMSRATTRASRPASPFVFLPPRTPSRAPAAPTRRSFVFSEWASSNRQTFVFEGSQRDGHEHLGSRQHSPCKFVPTKALTLAIQDAAFVAQVLEELPGVKTSDPRIVAMLDRIREGRTTRPQTPTAGAEGERLGRSMSSIRPLLPKRPPSSSGLGARTSSCRASLQGPEGGAAADLRAQPATPESRS